MHVEERELALHLYLRAEFPDDYEGDEDGFEWHRRFEAEVRPLLLNAALSALRSHPGLLVVPAGRGRDPDSAVEWEVRVTPRDAR